MSRSLMGRTKQRARGRFGERNVLSLSSGVSALSAPVVADQPADFGALTKSGAGGFTPSNGGGAIASASIDSGNTGTHWQISSAGVITPTAAGDTADLASGPYTLGCTFTNAVDSDTATITIATSGNDANGNDLANSYHVTDGELEAVIDLGSATIDGQIVIGRPGADIVSTISATLATRIEIPATHSYTTGLLVTSEDPSNPCFIRRILIRADGPIEFRDLVWRDDYAGVGVDATSNSILKFATHASNRPQVTLRRVEAYCSTTPLRDRFAEMSQSGFELNTFITTETTTNEADLTIIDCNLHDYWTGIKGEFRNFVVTGTHMHDAYIDHISNGAYDAQLEHRMENNFFEANHSLGTDPGAPHSDHIQYNNPGIITRNNNPIEIRGNIFLANGRETQVQGPFIADQVTGEGYVIIEENIIITGSPNGISCTRMSADSRIQNNTLIRNLDVDFFPIIDDNNSSQGAALISHNAVCGIDSASPSVETGNHEYGVTAAANENADYAALFDGSDFLLANFSSKSDIVTKLTASVGGALDNSTGRDIGAGWYYNYTTGVHTPFVDAVTYSQEDSDDVSSSAKVHTFSNMALGTVTASDMSIVCIYWRQNGSTISSVKIDGKDATELGTGVASGTDDLIKFFGVDGTVGTTGDVEITFNQNTVNVGVVTGVGVGIAGETIHDSDSDINTNTPSGSLDVPAGGFALAMAANVSTGVTWTGLAIKDTDEEVASSTLWYSTAHEEFATLQTGLSVSCTFAGSPLTNLTVFYVVSFGPPT